MNKPMLEGCDEMFEVLQDCRRYLTEFGSVEPSQLVRRIEAAMEAARRPEAAHPCPTCGAASPADNEFCSDGFHAPGETYWPVDPEADNVIAGLREVLEQMGALLSVPGFNRVKDAIEFLERLNPSPALVSDEQTSAVKKGR